MMASTVPMTSMEQLERLSSKPGVIATLTLDRQTSTTLSFQGHLTHLLPGNVASAAAISENPTVPGPNSVNGQSTNTEQLSEDERTSRFARMIWEYVNSSANLVGEMDSGDDLKLLRLRTKKHELVIVPDSKFIFVVAYDAKST